MNIHKALLTSACIILSIHYTTSASAKAPEFCFQSPQDYQIYQKYGDDAPNNPVQRKEIIINVKGSVTNKMIVLDASESKTPSGKVQFAWGNPSTPESTDSQYSVPYDGLTFISLPLTIKDPVCESSKSTSATYSMRNK